jgi:hypothetical protein
MMLTYKNKCFKWVGLLALLDFQRLIECLVVGSMPIRLNPKPFRLVVYFLSYVYKVHFLGVSWGSGSPRPFNLIQWPMLCHMSYLKLNIKILLSHFLGLIHYFGQILVASSNGEIRTEISYPLGMEENFFISIHKAVVYVLIM